MSCGLVDHCCMQKMKVLTQKMRKLQAFEPLFEPDRQTLWLREVMHAIKRDHWVQVIRERLHAKKIKDLYQQIRKLSAFKPFQD